MPEDQPPKPDFSKPTKWEKQAEEQGAKEAQRKEQVAKLFDPVALMESTNKIHEAEFPLLGKIRVGELTLADSFEIAKCENELDMTCMTAYLMLKKAYPEIPDYTPKTIREWVHKFPLAEGAALLLFIKGTPAFLRTQSLPGLTPAPKPKK